MRVSEKHPLGREFSPQRVYKEGRERDAQFSSPIESEHKRGNT